MFLHSKSQNGTNQYFAKWCLPKTKSAQHIVPPQKSQNVIAEIELMMRVWSISAKNNNDGVEFVSLSKSQKLKPKNETFSSTPPSHTQTPWLTHIHPLNPNYIISWKTCRDAPGSVVIRCLQMFINLNLSTNISNEANIDKRGVGLEGRHMITPSLCRDITKCPLPRPSYFVHPSWLRKVWCECSPWKPKRGKGLTSSRATLQMICLPTR